MKEQYSFSGNKNKKAIQTIEMSIAADGAQYLMYNLTNLYTNPLIAIIREYTANAYDSHMRIGSKNPVHVDFKEFYVAGGESHKFGFTGDALQITIQDLGIGMSLEDIADTYSKYGKSTKRDNNKEVGTYGLGSKSGLSLAQQVDVYAVKDEIATSAIIRLNSAKFPVIDIMDTEKVPNFPNGVTVSMVVRKPEAEFYRDLEKFFAAWKPGQILINNQNPFSIYEDNRFTAIGSFGKNIMGWLYEDDEESYVAPLSGVFVGPIYYHINTSDLKDNFHFSGDILWLARKAVINVPVGSIDLTPPREGIAYTERTIKNLRAAYNALFEEILDYYLKTINSLSQEEAFSFAAKNFKNIIALTAYLNKKNSDNTIPILWNGKNMNVIYKISDTYHDNFDILQHPKSEITVGSAVHLLKERSKYKTTKTFIRLMTDTYQQSWVTSNLKDYSLGINSEVKDVYALVIPENISSKTGKDIENNDELWFNICFPLIAKEDFLKTAREYRKLHKNTVSQSAITYPVIQGNEIKVEMLPASEIPAHAIIIDDKDKIVSNFSFKELIKKFGPDTYPFSNKEAPKAFGSLLNVMNTLGVSTDTIVYITGRNLAHTLKKIPQSSTLAEVIYAKYIDYPEAEQIYLRMITQLIALNKMDDLIRIEFVCREIIKNNLLENITDSFVQGFVRFMSDEIDSSPWTLKRVIASHLNGRRKNDIQLQEQITNMNYSTLNLFPFLATGIFHEQQTIDYLNTISLKQISFSGEFSLYNLPTKLIDFSQNIVSSLAHSRTWDFQ
jgi:hypothetical protein